MSREIQISIQRKIKNWVIHSWTSNLIEIPPRGKMGKKFRNYEELKKDVLELIKKRTYSARVVLINDKRTIRYIYDSSKCGMDFIINWVIINRGNNRNQNQEGE